MAPVTPRIILIDDGTLDTVLACQDCGQTYRFTFDSIGYYGDFLYEAQRSVREEHQCPQLPQAPMQGD